MGQNEENRSFLLQISGPSRMILSLLTTGDIGLTAVLGGGTGFCPVFGPVRYESMLWLTNAMKRSPS
jgi:hypothetical protein